MTIQDRGRSHTFRDTAAELRYDIVIRALARNRVQGSWNNTYNIRCDYCRWCSIVNNCPGHPRVYTNTSRVVRVDFRSTTNSRPRCVCTGMEMNDSPLVHDEQTKSFVPGFNSWLPSKLPTGKIDLRWSSIELTAASPGITLLRRWLRLNYTVRAFSLGSLEQAGLQQQLFIALEKARSR